MRDKKFFSSVVRQACKPCRLMVMLAAAAALTACGQTGPLKHPAAVTPAASAPAK